MVSIMFQHTPTQHEILFYTTGAGVFFFFVAAGYFMGKGYAKGMSPVPWLNVRKVLPFCFAYVFWVLVSMACLGFPDSLLGWLANWGIGSSPCGTVLWFLRDLMIFVLVSGALYRLPAACLAVLCMTALIVCNSVGNLNLGWDLPVIHKTFVFTHPRGLGAFALGMLLSRYSIGEMKAVVERIGRYVLVAFPFVFWWEACNPVSESALSMVFCILWLASVALWLLKCFPRAAGCLARLGPSVFLVYVAHALVFHLLMGWGVPRGIWWPWLLIVPCVFALLSGVYVLLRRYCPVVLKYVALHH